MNDEATLAPTVPVVRIGIRGLTNLTNNMIGGGLYVLIAETPSARFPMLAGSLGSALKEGLACTVIVPANPEQFLQRIESFDSSITPELITANRLQLFVMQDDFSKTMFRYGAEGFVKELEHFGIPENSYLIFDQADELLSLHDISLALDQVDVLRKWLEQRQVTMLAFFSRVTEAHSGTINALMDNLTGIARLGGDKEGLELTFDYWQSPEGTIAARNYRLTTLDSGLYEATTQAAPVEQIAGEDANQPVSEVEDAEPHFFYMDPDLNSVAKQMPGVWQRVDTLVGMMHATRITRSATSILRFQPDTNLRQLAETVHTLRLNLGRRAHIVVQEKGASLRYQNEALLLRLGVNLVVHKDVPTSRLPLLLESLKGQLFSRDVNINFEAALASVTPTRLRGYLLPLRFAREVEVILDRAETLNIPCALVIGKPAPSTTMIDILGHINLSRSGDLITADTGYCYLFLNACPQTVLLATLERLLGMPVDAAFDGVRFLIARAEIDSELAALSHVAERGDLPDYSSLSETPPPAELPGTESAPEAPEPPAPMPPAQAPATPVARLTEKPSTLAVSAEKTRDLPDQALFATAAKPPAAPPVKRGLATAPIARAPDSPAVVPAFAFHGTPQAPVFGKKEVPWATRAAPPAASASGSKEKLPPKEQTD